MSTVNSKMTALADEIRTLGGTTAKMGIDAMTTEVTAANTEIAEQADLIAQIQTALEGKAAGGDAEPVLQDKTVSPTTSSQTIEPDSGYDGLSSVTVNAMPTATQATPSITVSSSGLITASVTQTAGYVSAGTKSGTKQLTTQAAKTITPSTSSQTAVAKDVYTTGAVTVAAIPSTYVKPSATKAATTYTPSTSNQTIAAGTYCSGVQTIKGDSNLKAENIAEGVSIFGVTGTHSGGGSGGSSVETCTATFSYMTGSKCSYIDGNSLTLQTTGTIEPGDVITITVPVNSIIACTSWDSMITNSGSCSKIFYNMSYAAYYIYGDCQFKGDNRGAI